MIKRDDWLPMLVETRGGIGPVAIFFRLALRSIEIETLEDTPHRPFTGVPFLAGQGGISPEAEFFHADVV